MSAEDSIHGAVDEWLPEALRWEGRPTPETLDPLPGAPAVLLLVDEHERPIQALSTQHLKRVARSRLMPSEQHSRARADLAAVTRGIRWRVVHSPFEARWWYYRIVRRLHRDRYRKLISFGPAWFLVLESDGPVEQIRVTERIWCGAGPCIGPFPTQRTAQAALEGLWDLFDLCRYPEQLRKVPHGTRCPYFDMGRCDAPCDGTVALDDYRERTRRAWAFACGGAEEWRRRARERMMAEAAAQRFERAAVLKEQIAFADRWLREWADAARPQDQHEWLLLIPATRRKAVKPFLFRRGVLEDGPLIPQRKLPDAAAEWAAQRVRDAPSVPPPADAADATLRMEQTWLVAHLLRHKEARTVRLVPLAGVPADRIVACVSERLGGSASDSTERVAEP